MSEDPLNAPFQPMLAGVVLPPPNRRPVRAGLHPRDEQLALFNDIIEAVTNARCLVEADPASNRPFVVDDLSWARGWHLLDLRDELFAAALFGQPRENIPPVTNHTQQSTN